MHSHVTTKLVLSAAMALSLYLPGRAAFAESLEAAEADAEDVVLVEELTDEPEEVAEPAEPAAEAEFAEPEEAFTEELVLEVEPTEEPADDAGEEAVPEEAASEEAVVAVDPADEPALELMDEPDSEEALEEALDAAADGKLETKDEKRSLSSKAGPVRTTFDDVPESHWAYGVIRRAALLELMSGYSDAGEGTFGPEDRITRGQVVTVLWRMAGKPEASGAGFADVSSSDYFYEAVAWAASTGVVSGYGDGKFGPNDLVTREQLATMLTSYARRIAGISTEKTEDSFIGMSDASEVSAFARPSIAWSFSSGLMSGSGSKVNPKGSATRAEASKMFVRLYDRTRTDWQLLSYVTKTAVRKGTQIQIIPVVQGDASGLTYKYTVKKGSWSEMLGADGAFEPGGVGRYVLTVTATDENGVFQTSSAAVTSYDLTALTVKSVGNRKWSATASMGLSGDRVPGVEFRFTWTKADGSGGGTLRDWSADPSTTFTEAPFGSYSGKARIVVEARDAEGVFGSEAKQVSVNQLDAMSLKAQSFHSDTNYLILVDCSNNWVGIYQGYVGNWKRIHHWRCTSGAWETPTVKGTFKTAAKGYEFGDGFSCYYYTQFYGDYLFHSVIYQKYTFNVLDGRLGMSLSHGCVRLKLENAKWIYDNIPYGTTVHTYLG